MSEVHNRDLMKAVKDITEVAINKTCAILEDYKVWNGLEFRKLTT